MTAQAVQPYDPYDPHNIFEDLPKQERPLFLAALQAAVEPAILHQGHLQHMLRRWRLVANAANDPDYRRALRDAKSGISETVALEDIITTRRGDA